MKRNEPEGKETALNKNRIGPSRADKIKPKQIELKSKQSSLVKNKNTTTIHHMSLSSSKNTQQNETKHHRQQSRTREEHNRQRRNKIGRKQNTIEKTKRNERELN